MKSVCVLLDNAFTHDSRVEREINTLIGSGYRVTLIAWRKGADVPLEERRGELTIKRFEAETPKSRFLLAWQALIYGSTITKAFMQMAKEQNCDVIHANDLPTLEAAYRIARKKKIPFIYDSHEIYLENMKTAPKNPNAGLIGKIMRPYTFFRRSLVERFASPKAKVLITVNPEIEKYLQNKYRLKKTLTLWNVPSKKTLTGQGIDLRRRLGVAEDEKIIIFHGSLSEKRGVVELVRSAKLLPAKYKIVIMGYGPTKEELEKIKAEEKLENVYIIDAVSYDQLMPTLSSADLGIIPFKETSLNMRFASPNKLFELLMAGVPILSSDLPIMRRVIEQTGMGMVFKDVTPEGIAQAIEKFFNEFDFSRSKNFVSPYVWEAEEKKLTDVYAQL